MFEKALEVQIKCLKEFQDNGWIKNVVHATVPTRLVFPIRDYRSSRLEIEGGTNQVDCKFIPVGCEDERECFMASIYKVKPQRSCDTASEETKEVSTSLVSRPRSAFLYTSDKKLDGAWERG